LIMAISGLVVGPSVIMYFFTPALASAGRSGLSFRHFFVALFVNLGVAVAAIPFGLIAIASGKTIESHLTLPYGLSLLRKGIDLRIVTILGAVGPAYVASLVMGAALVALSLFVLQPLPPFYRLAVMVPMGGLLYFVLLAIFARSYLLSNLEELRSILKARPAAPANEMGGK